MKPTISVILTSYNSRERLRNALESYRYQTYPKDLFEVVVVDDGSGDGTQAWFENNDWNFPVKYIYNRPNKGRAGARNTGIHAASGDVILFSDCDMIAESDFIERHASFHQNSDHAVVCGSFWQSVYSHLYPTFDPQTFSLIKKLVQRDAKLKKRYASLKDKLDEQCYSHLLLKKEVKNIRKSPLIHHDTFISNFFAHYATGDFYFVWIFFVVMNVSVRKEHLLRIDGFDERFIGYGCEDTDVGYRLWKEGLSFIVDPTLKNYHQEHHRNHNQEAERISNMQRMVKKHQAAEMALYECLPDIGDTHRKSAFMFDRDRLLTERIVTAKFISQLNGLIWRCSQVNFPGIGEEAGQFDKLDEERFWAEVDQVRSKPEYASFVAFVEELYAKAVNRYEL
ncbi:glycosyltransferase family 2 protein [Paenibacillus sp. sgz302251]|uniref:glycosyltransferase family 2 protein n=1 Tax=Paenibacillus sp. sgz302251 TaxID=3414493 RepID=UPI003C79AA34